MGFKGAWGDIGVNRGILGVWGGNWGDSEGFGGVVWGILGGLEGDFGGSLGVPLGASGVLGGVVLLAPPDGRPSPLQAALRRASAILRSQRPLLVRKKRARAAKAAQ